MIQNDSFPISESQIAFYQSNQYIKLKGVLSPEEVRYFNNLISEKVAELSRDKTPLEDRDLYGQAFLQLMNLWTLDSGVKELVFSTRIAKIASDLMEVQGVRLYHDQALFKEAGGNITPWHADQYYWPLNSDKTITAWIPLQETTLEMGPIEFSAGSHKIIEGRNLEIGQESENFLKKKLSIKNFNHIREPFDVGEISFHSGWIFHRAGKNATKSVRKAMTIIYMDKDMRLKNPENKNQIADWNTWCPGTIPGKVIQTPLNPVIYSRN